MRRRGSVLGQLLLAFCVAAVLVGSAAVADYVTVTGQSATARQVTGRYAQLQRAENNLETDFSTGYNAILYFAATGEHAFLLPFGPAGAGFGSDLADLRRLSIPSLRDVIDTQAEAGAAWFALGPKIVATPPHSPAETALLNRASGLGDAFQTANSTAQHRLLLAIADLTGDSKQSLRAGLVWSIAALAVAVLLVLAASLSTLYTVSRPLRRLTGTVGRLTAGDHAARAAVTGTGEVRAVAQSVNTLADRADSLNAQEAESSRLRSMAREVGLRIREHLVADDVLREAAAGLRANIDTDFVYLRLLEDGKIGRPIGETPRWSTPGDLIRQQLPPVTLDRLAVAFRAQASLVNQDVQGPEGDRLPGDIREGLRRGGVRSQVLTPFGAGAEPLGLIIAQRTTNTRRWSGAEIDALESIAADLGRGLNQARLYEAENRLVEDLRELDNVRSDFFATVSHELRAPLTTIEGYVEMLGDGEAGAVTPQQGKMLETIARSSVRLRSLVEDLLTLSRLESGAVHPVLQPVNLAEVISGAVDAVRPSLDAKHLTLTRDQPQDALMVDGDAGQLDQVLSNLLSNAVKFTPDGGHVCVAVEAADGSALIRVTDTGIGIPERDQKELFSRFARASNATARRIPGTGLGLVIVRTIVVNHGGDVMLESVEGSGTTVTVRLPLLPAGKRPQPVG
jgi:signal transduction histidine kinase/HAMP domain-containing protein